MRFIRYTPSIFFIHSDIHPLGKAYGAADLYFQAAAKMIFSIGSSLAESNL
jgi:hypothetical protein